MATDRQIRLTDGALVLRAARKRAGFASAAAAAAKLGVGNAKFRAQEAGYRGISPEDAAKYGVALGIKAGDLLDPDPSTVDRMLRESRRLEDGADEQTANARWQVARRLKLARAARGYATAADACRKFKLTVQTYLGHEAGKRALSPAVARFYAAAFSIREEWLSQGHLPSGLGKRLDVRLASNPQIDNPARFQGLADPQASVDPTRLDELRAAAVERQSVPLPGGGEVLRGIRFSDLRRKGILALSSAPAQLWTMPPGYVRHSLRSAKDHVVVMEADIAASRMAPGDRLFVDVSQTDLGQGGTFLVICGKDIRVFDTRYRRRSANSGNLVVVGRIRARLSIEN